MKRFLFLFPMQCLLFLFVACGSANDTTKETAGQMVPAEAEKTNVSFEWLLGDWIRVGEKEGKETFEHWEKVSEISYKGFGFTLLGKDTVWQENMRWRKVGEQWYFAVMAGKGNKETVFVSTSMDENGFTIENEANVFPKKIVYYHEDDRLKATISGGGPVIDFEFVAYKGSLY